MRERGSGAGLSGRQRTLPLLPNDLYVFDNPAVCNGGPRLAHAGRTGLRAADDTAPIPRAGSFVRACVRRSLVRPASQDGLWMR